MNGEIYCYYYCGLNGIHYHCVNGPAMIYFNHNKKIWNLNYNLIAYIDKNE
jgi:hypothetical protein